MTERVHSDEWVDIWQGEARDVLAALPEQSVHTVVTSPPYFGLRDYRLPPSVWGGEDHEHVWGPLERGKRKDILPADVTTLASRTGLTEHQNGSATNGGRFCACGAWLGCLGLEPDPDLYVAHLVEVMRAVRRVLRDDGTLWLNLGDSFTSGGRQDRHEDAKLANRGMEYRAPTPAGLKEKDLIGVPWMAAFALRADGWYLRRDIIWSKPNSMPESVDDRPTSSHEYLFLLTKSPRYYFDMEAVREPVGESMKAAAARGVRAAPAAGYQHDEATRFGKTSPNRAFSDPESLARLAAGRNIRSVWTVPTEPYPGAHYAVFPRRFIEPPIRAGTSEAGVCATCGAPWERFVVTGERRDTGESNGIAPENESHGTRTDDPTGRGGHVLASTPRTQPDWPLPRDMTRPQARRAVELAVRAGLTAAHMDAIRAAGATDAGKAKATQTGTGKNADEVARLADEAKRALGGYYREFLLVNRGGRGWRPVCGHEGDPVPATVLDPFAGSGTTGLVAQRERRRAVLIDLNGDYLRQQLARATREFGVGGTYAREGAPEAEPPEDSLWAINEAIQPVRAAVGLPPNRNER